MGLQRKEVEVLVETGEKWKPVKKPKKERIKPVEPSTINIAILSSNNNFQYNYLTVKSSMILS
jgi:hypothetical protein